MNTEIIPQKHRNNTQMTFKQVENRVYELNILPVIEDIDFVDVKPSRAIKAAEKASVVAVGVSRAMAFIIFTGAKIVLVFFGRLSWELLKFAGQSIGKALDAPDPYWKDIKNPSTKTKTKIRVQTNIFADTESDIYVETNIFSNTKKTTT